MNRAGEFETALSGDLGFKAYKPNPLPTQANINIDSEMMELLTQSHSLLGKLDVMAELLPDKDLFLGAYVRKEALLSSQIEGIQATMEDILSMVVNTAVNLEVNDVVNYVDALNFVISDLQQLPICKRLLCDIHKVLMRGVRGQEKAPGEFRRSQNWIGPANSNLSNARYIPPTAENMTTAMSDLGKYINDDETDVIIKAALAHYQFETIHPFLDGNGRIGRMLITLILLSNGKIKNPILNMSLFLKLNRIEYYDRLSEVRKSGNYEQWIKFFLGGVIITCKDGISTIQKLSGLIKSDTEKVSKMRSNTMRVYRYLKEHPIIDIKTTAKALDLSFNTVNAALMQLTELEITAETEPKKRGKIYSYINYIEILKEGT